MSEYQQADPFVAEAVRHGWPLITLRDPMAARDACRAYADGEMCDHCDDLIQAFDAAMMQAFWGKTGPFG